MVIFHSSVTVYQRVNQVKSPMVSSSPRHKSTEKRWRPHVAPWFIRPTKPVSFLAGVVEYGRSTFFHMACGWIDFMYLYVFICIYVLLELCMCIYTCIYIYTYPSQCIHLYIYIYLIYRYIHIYLCVYLCICMYIVCIYIYTYILDTGLVYLNQGSWRIEILA